MESAQLPRCSHFTLHLDSAHPASVLLGHVRAVSYVSSLPLG